MKCKALTAIQSIARSPSVFIGELQPSTGSEWHRRISWESGIISRKPRNKSRRKGAYGGGGGGGGGGRERTERMKNDDKSKTYAENFKKKRKKKKRLVRNGTSRAVGAAGKNQEPGQAYKSRDHYLRTISNLYPPKCIRVDRTPAIV